MNGQSFGLRLTGVPQDDQTSISQTYTISDKGTIKLLYLKEMKAASMKPSELMRSVEQAYIKAEIFTKPNVVIILGEAGTIQRYISQEQSFPYPPARARVSRCGRLEHILEPQDPGSHSKLER